MKYTRDQLIKYRIEKAKECLVEANLLAESNHWNTVANRLYYASFYAITALFVKFQIAGTTHNGIKNNFHKEFVKTGILDKEYGKLYNNLFNKRQEGDYQDFIDFEEDIILPLISKVDEFIKHIEKNLL